MIKLKKPLKIRKNGEVTEATEIEIKAEDFTGTAIIAGERAFLYSQGIFPTNGMEESRDFLAYVACQILSCRYEDFLELGGEDFLKITDVIKNFYTGSGSLNFLMDALLEQKEVKDIQEKVDAEDL